MKIEITLGKLRDIEKTVILETLKLNNNNITHTARALGLGIRTVQRKLSRYNARAKVVPGTFNKLNIKVSSFIREAHYNNASLELQISLKTGEVYSYDKVPLSVTKDFETAESSGSFYVKNIAMKFQFTQV